MGRRRWWAGLGLVVALGVAAFAACSDDDTGGGSDGVDDGGGERVEEEATLDESVDADTEAGGAAEASPAPESFSPDQLPDAEREIIYTAQLEVVADDVDAAADEAVQLVGDAGGIVFDQAADLAGDARQISITFKVPPDVFDETLEQLSDLGDLEHRDVQTEDITGVVVDVEARLATAQASADRLRALLAQTGSVDELVAVEQALSEREAEVESLTAQLRVLREQVDLATVSLRLVETPPDDDPSVSDDIPGFVDGLRNGGVAFVNVLQVIATAVGFLLPFLAVVAVVGGGLLLVLRRRGGKQGD